MPCNNYHITRWQRPGKIRLWWMRLTQFLLPLWNRIYAEDVPFQNWWQPFKTREINETLLRTAEKKLGNYSQYWRCRIWSLSTLVPFQEILHFRYMVYSLPRTRRNESICLSHLILENDCTIDRQYELTFVVFLQWMYIDENLTEAWLVDIFDQKNISVVEWCATKLKWNELSKFIRTDIRI